MASNKPNENQQKGHCFFLPTPLPTRRPRPPIPLTPEQNYVCNSAPTYNPTSISSTSLSETSNYHPRGRKHSNLITKHSRDANLPALAVAIRNAEADGFKLNVVNYTAIAHAHNLAGNPRNTFSVLGVMREKNILPTNVTLRVAARAAATWLEKPQAAKHSLLYTLRWCAAHSTDTPDPKTWNLAMRNLYRLEQWDAVPLVLQWMQTGKVYIDDGHDDNLVSHNIPLPNSWSYNTCLLSYGRLKKYSKAYSLFAHMLMGKTKTLKPDIVSYNTILEMGLVRGGLPLESSRGDNYCDAHGPHRFVRSVLASMQRQDIQPSFLTETLLLRILSRKDATPPESSFLWERARTAELQISNRNLPDKPYYDALLAAFARCGDHEGIVYGLEKMKYYFIKLDKLSIRALVTGVSQHGDADLARRIIDIAYEQGELCDERAYTSVITAYSRKISPNYPAATSLLKLAAKRGVIWTSAMINATISSHGDNLTAAVSFWKDLQTDMDMSNANVLRDRCTYDALFRVCGRSARPDFALRIFYAARKVGDVLSNTTESKSMYSAFCNGALEADVLQRVEGNPIKKQYLRQLQAECGVSDDIHLSIERIRIKL